MMGPNIKFAETLKKKNGASRAWIAVAPNHDPKIITSASHADAKEDTTIEW